MKITGLVEVNNRLLPSTNISGRRKPQRTCVAIARKSPKSDDLYLIVQAVQTKQIAKYKLESNIEKVFTKFVNDGKATIRVKEPPHDLIMRCEPLQLKGFLNILQRGLLKKISPSDLAVADSTPKSLTHLAVKTKITVKSKSEYPVLQGFPRTTEVLTVSGLERKSFDRQILRLQSLRVLDLSDNLLNSLPSELASLPHLTELYLASNRLGTVELIKWSWLSGTNICRNLRLLDISKNSLKEVPCQIRRLESLVTLKLADNQLQALPQGIGSLISLKYLDLHNNLLKCLPGCMRKLRLSSLDISGNLFDNFPHVRADETTQGALGLTTIAARVALDSRTYYDASLIPLTLVTYLDKGSFCVCGKSSCGSLLSEKLPLELASITVNFTSSSGGLVLFECYFCSIRCSHRHTRR